MNIIFQSWSTSELLNFLSGNEDVPDIIISEVMMPEINGYSLVEKLRQQERFSKVKILALTADATPGTAKMAQDAGFDAFLSKPVFRKDLVNVIRTMFGDKCEEKEIITRHTAAEVSLEGMMVLAVDDVAANRELLGIYLEMFGCVRDEACNGAEALEKIRANRYDVCLMDMQMPVLDGIQATIAIRKELRSDLPVIALTAAVMKEDQDRAFFAGMNDFLTKPIDANLLKSKLLKWGKRRSG